MKRLPSIFYYVFRSKKRHGTHSPFVYEFVDKCIRHKPGPKEQQIIRSYQKKVKQDTTLIQVADFGAGSKKLGQQRQIKEIYSIGKSGKKYGQLLFSLTRYYQPKRILEMGTSLGTGTLYLHLGNPSAQLTSIEGCPKTLAYTVENFPVHSKQIQFIQETFKDYLNRYDGEKFDLIFIDGDHRGASLKEYVRQLLPHTHNHTIWILDDIRWSDDMWQAWQEISQQENFHVSMDLLRMGILVLRPEQFKEHFYIHI